ncbi:MAG TPA: hypothetical protein VM553_07100 [Dongiaceae bacterium]|nr:hypothetical protein [Dongiaceae bacterium]
MKHRSRTHHTLRLWAALLLLTLFSQTLQAAVRSVHCAWGEIQQQASDNLRQTQQQPDQQQHCHDNQVDAIQQAHDTSGPHQDATASHCQPGCSCCWNACSASLSSDTRAALSFRPNSETYRTLPALLPASPVEQALRPPCAA